MSGYSGGAQRDAIDHRVLAEFLVDIGGDRQSLVELVEMYLEDAPKLMHAMSVALQNDDAAALGAASHTLKSTSASMGAMGLSDQCGQLQDLASVRNLAGAKALMPSVHREFERVQRQLSTDYR